MQARPIFHCPLDRTLMSTPSSASASERLGDIVLDQILPDVGASPRGVKRPYTSITSSSLGTIPGYMIIPGNKVHHFKTGREGTVVKMLDNGWQMTIEFDKWNQAGMPDGAIEVRRVSAFNLGSAWALRRHYGGQCALCRRCA